MRTIMKLLDPYYLLERLVFVYFFVFAKQFVVVNEETVVALCFLSFMIFSFEFFGQSVQESLDERTDAIRLGFHSALVLEQMYCQKVIHEYEKPSQAFGTFLIFGQTLLALKLVWYRHLRSKSLATFLEQTLRTLIDKRLQERVQQITHSRKTFQERWLHLMASEFEVAILTEFQKTDPKVQETLLAQSISSLGQSRSR